MHDGAQEPEKSSTRAKWSEAAGQAILLGAVAWALFALIQSHWYIPKFDVHPFAARWVAVTFVTGAVPPLLVLLLAFLASWLIGALRGRADPWRSYRDGLLVACVFMLVINIGIWIGQAQ